jgi:hypothetical protein
LRPQPATASKRSANATPDNVARETFLHPANPLNNERGFRAKRKPAFLHPALALYGKRNSGQKGNLFFRFAKLMLIFRRHFRLLDLENNMAAGKFLNFLAMPK